MNKELFIELQEASKPLQDFLMKHFDSMVKVEVAIDNISVFRAEMGMPTLILDKVQTLKFVEEYGHGGSFCKKGYDISKDDCKLEIGCWECEYDMA